MRTPETTAPTRVAHTKKRLPCGFVVVCVAAILSGSHLFLSTISTIRRDTQALQQPSLDTPNNDTILLASLERQVKFLQKQVERRAKHQDLRALEERIHNLTLISQGRGNDQEETFCVPWQVNMDVWWTHHADWTCGKENKTHYCFALVPNGEKAAFLRRLYENQFHGDCSSLKTIRMLSAGFGADLDHIIDGLLYGLQNNRPIQVYQEPTAAWHYAANKDGSKAVCETRDFYCYFLNLTKCKANSRKVFRDPFLTDGPYKKQEGMGRWMLEYTMRPQTWLRKAMYDFTSKLEIQTPCTVMHVRRSDIVLHGKWSRKYRPMDDYVNAMKNITNNTNILLLTDDANAIGEAQTKYPEYNWMYIPRKRHKGSAGGFENQVPSNNPKQEVIIILSILKLVRQCSSLIHTYGNFAELLIGEMDYNDDFVRVNLDELDKWNGLFSENNSLSVNVSTGFT